MFYSRPPPVLLGREIPFPSKIYTDHFSLEWIQLDFQSEFCMKKQKIHRQIYDQDSRIQISYLGTASRTSFKSIKKRVWVTMVSSKNI